MSFYIAFGTKKSDVIFLNTPMSQAVHMTSAVPDVSQLQSRCLACALQSLNKKQLAIFFQFRHKTNKSARHRLWLLALRSWCVWTVGCTNC